MATPRAGSLAESGVRLAVAMAAEAVAVVLRNWRRVFFALMTCGIGRPELLEFGWFEVEPVTNSLRGSDSEGIWPQRAQRSQRLENLPFPQINHQPVPSL